MPWDGLAGRARSGARLLSCYDRDSGAEYAKDTLLRHPHQVGRVPEDDSHRYPDAGRDAEIQGNCFLQPQKVGKDPSIRPWDVLYPG